MLYEGYKLNGYNATYEDALFDIRKGREDAKKCVLSIEDINSGIEFILEIEKESEIYEQFSKKFKQKSKTGSWTSKNPNWNTEQQGPSERNGRTVITFGRASGVRKHSVYAKRDDQPMP